MLTLQYRGETPIPVEVEGLTTDWALDKTLADVEQFEIFHGNERLPLAEMFRVTGDPRDGRHVWEGNLAGVHWIGAQMTQGEVVIDGPAGRHVGSEMQGGRIEVNGNVGGWVGTEMTGGVLHVHGNAGHLAGAAYRGSPRGMTGGILLIDGNAGNEVGLSMRRGLIAVGESVGDMLGFNMIAGTVLVFGGCGIRPGAGMRRGTLGVFGDEPPQLLPTFRWNCRAPLTILALIVRQLDELGFRVPEHVRQDEVDVYHGDLVALGKGEVFLAAREPGQAKQPGVADNRG